MDFTTQYAFPGAHQPFHPAFMPPTPSHSQSAASDHQFNSASPPDIFGDSLPSADHFAAAFEYAPGFSAASAPFPGPPTPPGFGGGGGQQNQQNQQHQQNQQNQQHQHQQQQQQQQQQQHQQRQSGALPACIPSTTGSLNGGTSIMFADNNADDLAQGRGAGSEDDDNMTPAQSRRKAQNRAAQRAFRERKEKHVKDLESKLASLEAAQKEAATENERLRRDLQKMSTENEILRATSAIAASASASASPPEPLLAASAAAAAITSTGPMTYQPTDFYSDVLQGHKNKAPSHRIVTSDDGQRLLAAGAAWDFIIAHDLYKRGLVDVSKVSDLMKHCAKCDGQGPVFSESDIACAIEQSIASGSDDLL